MRAADAVLGGHVEHARPAHVIEQRPWPAGEQPLEEDTLAQARLGRLQSLEAAGLHRPPHDNRAGQDQIGPGRLDAGHRRPLGRRQGREALDQLIQGIACDLHPLNAVGRQPGRALCRCGEVADRPADPDQAKPVLAPVRQPVGSRELRRDVLAEFLELLALGGPVGRQEPLAHPHGPQLPGARTGRFPVLHADELHRATAEVKHTAVAQRARVDRRQIAVAGLGLAAEHPDRCPQALVGPAEEALGVLGIADRAGRDGVHRRAAQPARAAELREHVQRRQRPLDRLLAEPAAGHQALPDANRLVDLIGPPPAPVPRLEDDQPERVRSEVDDSEPLVGLHYRQRIRLIGGLRRVPPGPGR